MCYIGKLIAITLCLPIISGHECQNVSFTSDRLLCLGTCKSQDGGEFCATHETRDNRDVRSLSPCITSREAHRQYFTYPIRGLRLKCSGLCGTLRYSYSWCFIEDDGAWNLCSPLDREPIFGHNGCFDVCFNKTNDNDYYTCTKKYKNEYDSIACPSPIISLHHLITSAVGRRNDYAAGPVRRKRQLDVDKDYISIHGIEQTARMIENTNTNKRHRDSNSPVSSYVVRTAHAYRRGVVDLTLVIKATIRKRHIDDARRRGRSRIPSSTSTRMILMDRLQGDERGHLLAHSLGGPNEDFNFAPQTPALNRNRHRSCGWYDIEGNIRTFLNRDSNSRVEWTLVVDFNLTSSRRPVGFALRHIYYDPFGRIVRQGFNDECYFSNNP